MSGSVAVCIPTYNQSAFLAKAVESCFKQTYTNVEVWISDDCSTDNTQQVAENLQKRYPNLHYIRQKRNLGISRNNNWLLAQPTADFIVRLDSDDFLNPTYVEELLALLVKYPLAGYAHCNIQEVDQDDNPLRVRRLGGRTEYQSPEEALRASAAGYRVAANICMFRTQILRDLGFYTTEINFCEDWDLSARIADAGWGNAHNDEVLANYRVWLDSGQVRPRRKRIELEGCLYVYEKTLTPAFIKRGWSLSAIQSHRQNAAKAHAIVLDSPVFTLKERQNIRQLLYRLGDSPSLRIRIRLLRIGAGPLLRCQERSKLAMRDFAKKILSLVRSPRRNSA